MKYKEVKDTLDKKAVVALMTECFENHGIDKKKLEEMKYIQQEGVLPPKKNKALAGAKDKIIRGLGKKEKNEFAEMYEDVGFRLYLILARMLDIDPRLLESLKFTPLQQKAFNYYRKNCQSVEIVKDDELQKANFRVKSKRVLREEVKEMLKWSVDRSSPSNKIRDLMAWSGDIMKDIAYQRKILSNPVAIILTKGWIIWNHLVTILSFAINILMLVTWTAKASLQTPGLFKNSTAIPPQINDPVPEISRLTKSQYVMAIYILGGLHNFFCLLVFISYFVGNHPRLPNPKAILESVKSLCKSKTKKEEEAEEEKGKQHVSKMDAKLLSFTTFYYAAFLALSIAGTLYHGYFFAFHLLNIVNGNQLLSGVIKAVTQNGRSLVWVGILGLCVFYLYAIISFAMMRSMFNPDDYLYCDTLWQCTLTVIRYGLIGDLFENVKAHDSEKDFQMFGFVVLYHVTFFIFITTIGLNIIFGIIVDTFSELRDLKWTAESDMRDTCFICSRNSYDFEHHGKGFEHHVRHEHNMWAYIFFFIHLNRTKVNDYTAIEMFVFKLLLKENYDFFPLDRALSLAAMGQDSTEVKIDDLLYQVTSIVEKQKREELEKKRMEERMRQKAWEEKHRLNSFRRKAQTRSADDILAVTEADQVLQQDTLGVDSPPSGLSPSFSRRPSVVGVQRRPSGVGLGYQAPANRHDRYRRRRSVSPMDVRDASFRRLSRGYEDDQEPLIGQAFEERVASPTLYGVDNDLLDISPVPFSRRQSFSADRMRSPRLSLATSPREHSSFFSEDPIPYLRQMTQQYTHERRLSQTYPEGRPLTLPPGREREREDAESISSGEGTPETRF